MSDTESMVLVSSSDEEGFFSDSSNHSWIFPLAKPPPDANYDDSFIQFIEETIDMANPCLVQETEQYSAVEQGRRYDVADEIPLLLHDDDSFSLPDFKTSDPIEDGLPPWLCLDSNQEADHFKNQYDKYSDNKKIKIEELKIPQLPSTSLFEDKPISISHFTDPWNEERKSFTDQILMTSTPNLNPIPSPPVVTKSRDNKIKPPSRESRLPRAVPRAIQKPLKRPQSSTRHRGTPPTKLEDIFDDESIEKRRVEMFASIPKKKRQIHTFFNLRK